MKIKFNAAQGGRPPSRSEIERRYRGMRSKVAGEQFEKMIEASCKWYKQQGLACIDKTPEPMKLNKYITAEREYIRNKQAQAEARNKARRAKTYGQA